MGFQTLFPVVTAAQMGEIDRSATDIYHIPSSLLMEEAGRQMLREAESFFAEALVKERSHLLFLCGPGNNGGDALVAARGAAVSGYAHITILLVKEKQHREAALQLSICQAMGLPVLIWRGHEEQGKTAVAEADFLFDGITGAGLKGRVRGEAEEIITFLCRKEAVSGKVIAIDNPSGAHEAAGPDDPVVPADLTITMGLVKKSLLYPHIRELCGTLTIFNPGFPLPLLDSVSPAVMLDRTPSHSFASLNSSDYKNSRGHALLFAGSVSTPGAALLSARTAAKSRAGLVTLYTDKELYPIAVHDFPSLITRKAGSEPLTGREIAGTYQAVLAGPGWGIGARQKIQLKALIEAVGEVPLIIDADGLTLLGELIQEGFTLEGANNMILTPHPGEFARLSGCSIRENPESLIDAVSSFAQRYRCTVLFKSHMVYIASKEGKLVILEGLNPALGTAGSGDVLAGLVTGLSAAGLNGFGAAWKGAALHQEAGRLLAEKQGLFSADELISVIARRLGRKANG